MKIYNWLTACLRKIKAIFASKGADSFSQAKSTKPIVFKWATIKKGGLATLSKYFQNSLISLRTFATANSKSANAIMVISM